MAGSSGWFVLPDGGNRNWESESLECFVRILAGCVVGKECARPAVFTILTDLRKRRQKRWRFTLAS